MKFPTDAEKALANWDKRRSFSSFCRKLGATIERNWTSTGLQIEYIFDDDTRVVTTGRGRSWKARSELP